MPICYKNASNVKKTAGSITCKHWTCKAVAAETESVS